MLKTPFNLITNSTTNEKNGSPSSEASSSSQTRAPSTSNLISKEIIIFKCY